MLSNTAPVKMFLASLIALLALNAAARSPFPEPYPANGKQAPPLFAPVVPYSSDGQNATSVAVGDVNGDGNPDIVVANDCTSSTNCSNGNVSVLLGNGDGTFRSPVSYNSGGYHAAAVALADVNGNGRLDIVVAECQNSTTCNGVVGVLSGNGDGTFQSAAIYSTGAYGPTSVALADVNGDEKLDILVANQCVSQDDCNNGAVSVLLNSGNGSFESAVTYGSGGQYAESVAAADVNGDHKIDLVIANQCIAIADCGNAVVGVLLGNGNGTFQNATTYSTGGQFSYSVAIADVNGDSKPDLLVTNRCTLSSCAADGDVGILLGNGNGTFKAAVTYDSGGQDPYSVTAADVNGDGYLDLEVANNCANSTCYNGSASVLLGNGNGTFQPATSYNSGGYTAGYIVAQDVNGDGKPDLIVANLCTSFDNCSGGEVGVLLGVQLGTITTVTSSVNPSNVNQSVTFTATISSNGGQVPNGETVTFQSNDNDIGTAPTMNGAAKFTTSSLMQGVQYIKALYPGDPFYGASSGAVKQTVDQYTSTTTLVSSPDPSTYGQTVQLTATVKSGAPGGPTGTVTFERGTVNIGQANLANGKAVLTVSNFSAGQYTLTALYSGDAQSTRSSGTTSQTVKLAPTSTTLSSSLNPSKSNQFVKFTATVSSSAGTPPGPVAFMDGSRTLATIYLSNGVATYGTSSLSVGSHNITAVYQGNMNFQGSKSPVVVQVVQQ